MRHLLEAIERATREGRATTGDDLRTAARTEGLKELLLELPTYTVAAFLGGQQINDGPFCPVPHGGIGENGPRTRLHPVGTHRCLPKLVKEASESHVRRVHQLQIVV